ncbi:MAG: cytochrome c-type biogenesis CcmF C-terminal domain-containing protein, partial [Planktomarina sp.]
AIRTFVKPLANWIWAGTIIMALGGLASLMDRRYRLARVGAKS